jgi:fructosamine-3-kinase
MAIDGLTWSGSWARTIPGEAGALLLYEALPERRPDSRESQDWRSTGQVLAALHQVGHERFGLDGPGGFFGPLPHPEADLALVDYFQPVPDDLFAGYRDIAPIDPGFAGRRELWRLAAYLAVIAVDGDRPFGRRYLDRLAAAVQAYR